MITFTKEQLIASAHARIEFAEMMLAGELEPLKERTWSIELELARIALASLEAEASGRNPVLAYADSYRNMANHGVESIPVWSVITDLERNIAPLFTAPPALVVPVLKVDWQENEFSAGWNACHAATLQGAEPVTTACKLPELRYLDSVKFNADCALQDPESIYAQEFFMSLDEVFGERGNYTEPVQAKAVSILIAEIFRLRGYPSAPRQEVKP